MDIVQEDLKVDTPDADVLKSAQQIGRDIQKTIQEWQNHEHISERVIDTIPKNLQDKLKAIDLDQIEYEANAIIAKRQTSEGLLESKFGCSVCTTLTYTGLVAAVGGAVILSGGLSIPAVLAASGYSVAGMATVISAMTGVTQGAVMAMLTASGATLGVVVLGLCEAMGSC